MGDHSGGAGRVSAGRAAGSGSGTRFPTDLAGLENGRGLGGSTGARLATDPATKLEYVRKTGSSEGHLREETNADLAYQAMGIDVPAFRLYETGGRPVKLSKFIPNTDELGDIRRSDPARFELVRKKIQANFVADAVLGNWDVAGMGMDNIKVDAANRPWRIDNGGALRYRAQGAPKGAAWNSKVGEIWTLRDRSMNRDSAALFGDLPFSEIGKQMVRVGKMKERVLKVVDPALRDMLGKRFDTVARMGAAAVSGASETAVRALGE